MEAAAADALGIRHLRHLQPQVGTRDLARADAADVDPQEGALHAGGPGIRGDAIVHGELGLGPEVGGRQVGLDVGVGRDRGERRVGRAERRRPADAHAAGAGVGRGARVAVGAGRRVRRVHAARGRIARIVGADIRIVAVGGRAADADAAGAGVRRGAGVAVGAGRGVRRVHTARGRVAGVVGADVAIVAVEGRAADADAAGAGVGRGAGVAVVAHRQGGCAAAAHPGAVTGGGGETRGGAGAGLAGRLELTGGGAAVAGHRVAVVALFTRVEEAVAADRRDLPHEVEEV